MNSQSKLEEKATFNSIKGVFQSDPCERMWRIKFHKITWAIVALT